MVGNAHHLTDSKFLGTASTVQRLPLFLDAYRIPYLVDLPDTGHPISGEIYHVTRDVLADLDLLEGVAQGRYHRREITVKPIGILRGHRRVSKAWCYLLLERDGVYLFRRELLSDYSEALHKGFVPPGEGSRLAFYIYYMMPTLPVSFSFR